MLTLQSNENKLLAIYPYKRANRRYYPHYARCRRRGRRNGSGRRERSTRRRVGRNSFGRRLSATRCRRSVRRDSFRAKRPRTIPRRCRAYRKCRNRLAENFRPPLNFRHRNSPNLSQAFRRKSKPSQFPRGKRIPIRLRSADEKFCPSVLKVSRKIPTPFRVRH